MSASLWNRTYLMRRYALCLGLWCATTVALADDPYCGTATRCVARSDSDPRVNEFLKRVLDAMHLTYKVENNAGQQTIWWTPPSEVEEKEVDGRLLQYSFAINACPPEKWPTPGTPSGTITRCD